MTVRPESATWDAFISAEEKHWFGEPVVHGTFTQSSKLNFANVASFDATSQVVDSAERVATWIGKCCRIPAVVESSPRAEHGARVPGSRISSGGVSSASTGSIGRGPDPPKSCSSLARQQASRRSRSPTSTGARLPPLTCKNTLPLEGHSPASHITARASCACEQCLLALHAAPQTRQIAIQAAHQRDLNNVIPEGDEDVDARGSFDSPARGSPVKSMAQASCSHTGMEACSSLAVQEALASAASVLSQSSATQRSTSASPAPTNLLRKFCPHHCHSHKVAAPSPGVLEDGTPVDTVLAWYTPFSSSSELCEMDTASTPATCGGNARRVDWSSAERASTPERRTCTYGVQRALAVATGSSGNCGLSNMGSESSKDPDRPSRRKSAAWSSLRNSNSSKLMSRSSQFVPQSSTSDLQRSVTCQTVPTPFAEPSGQLPSHVSGCTSVELASMCLPSVTLTTTVAHTQTPADTSPGRLNSCPSLPAAPWAGEQAVVH